MGHKVNPNTIRLKIIKFPNSKWGNVKSKAEFAANLYNDYLLRKLVHSSGNGRGILKIKIERHRNKIVMIIYSSRPADVIGRKGQNVDLLKRKALKITEGIPVQIKVQEVRKPELQATLVAENIAQQLEGRVPYRRTMKRSLSTIMKLGAKGGKIVLSGRLSEAEIARSESCQDGRVPLHTYRADIDYGFCEAKTTHGIIGVKVWIFKSEILRDNRRK